MIFGMTDDQKEYAAFIDRLGLKFFEGREFAIYADRVRDGVKNSLPPEALWMNIVPTLIVLDEIRRRAKTPITVLSAYRSPAYNRAVGGERASFHMKHMAIDFNAAGMSARELWTHAVAARNKKYKLPDNAGEFVWRGGIGQYPGFVHIDCRGYNANW